MKEEEGFDGVAVAVAEEEDVEERRSGGGGEGGRGFVEVEVEEGVLEALRLEGELVRVDSGSGSGEV